MKRNNIDHAWTPIKPVTTQFAVRRNKAAHVVRKQFPLRPAAAKIIHHLQGDTETKIVVNFNTKMTIPHIHYVGHSRVTTFEGLNITDLCENKIAVDHDVAKEMDCLRTSAKLSLCESQLYDHRSTKIYSISSENIIILGALHVNWPIDTEKRPLYNLLVNDKHYKQLISTHTTDSKTVIDHIYTNIHVENLNIQAGVLETYFTAHKAVWALFNTTKNNKYM